MPDNIAYYIEGNETAATLLKLKLNVNNPDTPTDSVEEFFSIAKLLLSKVLGEQSAENFLGDVGMHFAEEGNHISLVRQDWNSGIKGGYNLMLSITKA
jgi:hypothetical protein